MTPAPAAPADLAVRDFNRTLRRVALLLIAVGVFARVFRYAMAPAMWGDEAMLALNFTVRGFGDLTKTLDFYQVCPVPFLWAERAAYLLFGGSEWALRFLPMVAGVAGLVAFWQFARETVSPTAAVLAVGLLAAARWPIVMSSTLKPYAGDLFWASALLTLAARWHRRPERLGVLVLLAAAVPVAVTASYPVVFVAGAISLYLLPVAWRHPDRRARIAFAAYNLLLVGAFAGCLAMVGREQLDPGGGSVERFMITYWRDGFPPDEPIRFPLWLLGQQAGRMSAYPIGDANGGSALTVLLFAAGVWHSWRGGNRPLVVLCLVPFALNLAAAVLYKYPYGGCCRLSQHLAPAICLMAGVGWARVHEWWAPSLSARLRWVWLSFAVLAGYAGGQVLFDAVVPDHDPWCRWAKNLYHELRHEVRPGDRFVLDPDSLVNNPTHQANQEVRWYTTRFRNQVLAPGCVPIPADVPDRLWAFAITQDEPRDEPGREFVCRIKAAGWVPVADVLYSHRPDKGEKLWHNCRVVCFRRPDAPDTTVRLNTGPQ